MYVVRFELPVCIVRETVTLACKGECRYLKALIAPPAIRKVGNRIGGAMPLPSQPICGDVKVPCERSDQSEKNRKSRLVHSVSVSVAGAPRTCDSGPRSVLFVVKDHDIGCPSLIVKTLRLDFPYDQSRLVHDSGDHARHLEHVSRSSDQPVVLDMFQRSSRF